ncbi:MAG: hypothetical protein PHE86_03900 [Candidatus Marinimicrobia bacterium]|nr:hypothetical protein [Candidatus Neomarinimicrobiota bacterium]MDD5582092.1 hypothetical protein [Candidatus Neomarinimicrobiota bacterium]
MISVLKDFFLESLHHAYQSANTIKEHLDDDQVSTVLTESIRECLVSAHLLSIATGKKEFFEETSVFQRVLNICQVYCHYQDRVNYFETSTYQNRRGALRGALYIETFYREEFFERQKKLSYQLEQSFHPQRKNLFFQKINSLSNTINNPNELMKASLDYLLPLVLFNISDLDKLSMKVPGEFLQQFQTLHAYLRAMGSNDSFWEEEINIVENIINTFRRILCLDDIFSTIKKNLMEEQEKISQALKEAIFSQYKMLDLWEEILQILIMRNNKDLIKFLTQIIRDRKKAVEMLIEQQKMCLENRLWDNYYKKLKDLFVTLNNVG